MTTGDRVVAAFGAFVAGIAFGMLFAPESGSSTRRIVREKTDQGRLWLKDQVQNTQESIIQAGDEAADQVKRAAEAAAGKYLPDLSADDETWQSVYTETHKDVQNEKRFDS